MDINKNQDSIPEGEQFIISCTAQGPPDMQFKWFKDGYPINTSISTRYKKILILFNFIFVIIILIFSQR